MFHVPSWVLQQEHPNAPDSSADWATTSASFKHTARPVRDLSALFLGVTGHFFFLDKKSQEQSGTYLFLLKLRTKGSEKMLLQLGLAILFCYKKVVLSLPRLQANPCLDIRVLAPLSSYSQAALASPLPVSFGWEMNHSDSGHFDRELKGSSASRVGWYVQGVHVRHATLRPVLLSC